VVEARGKGQQAEIAPAWAEVERRRHQDGHQVLAGDPEQRAQPGGTALRCLGLVLGLRSVWQRHVEGSIRGGLLSETGGRGKPDLRAVVS